jgi:concanavalin A-like lectin/glucanase superfamily protein/putative Ig domain-containing protein/lipid A 3-O-deacylase PagL
MKKSLILTLVLVTLTLMGTEVMAQTRTINLNTGYDQWSKVKINEGEQDNEWRVISDSVNGAPQPPPATGRPADVVSDVGWITKNPSLAVNFPYSRWISITPNQGKPLPLPPPSNKFQYAFYFTLPVGFSSPVLTMKLSADDRITKITLNDCSFSTGSGGGFNQNPPSGVNTSLLSCFNAGPTLNVITVDVEDTGAVITGLIVDGTVTYKDCDRRPIRDIPGLTSITFWENTFAAPTQHKFEKSGPELTTKLSGPLTTGNSDFESLPGIESYDVFYSDWDGSPNPAGQFVTIEADLNGTGAPAGGGLNLARVDFNGTGQFASSVASFVALGNNAMPNDVGKAVDVDPDVLTDTTMGNTIGQTQRLRVTVGFPCPCVPPPSGMVAWWPGDANAIDISDGNNGTLVGGVTYAPGKVNQAFSFPSLSSTGSDRVRLTSGPSANTFTIEAWVFANQHGPSAYRTIYADNLRGFWLKKGRLNWWQGDDRFVGDTEVTPGAWHHIALTYSNGTFTGYLDGKADGTSFFPSESLPTGTGLGIGGHSNFVPEDFDGLIDELRVYDRALDPAEIQGIFNVGSAGNCKCAPPPSGMVAWWPLDKLNSDGEYDDLAGGDNNGTPFGNPSQILNQYVGNSLRSDISNGVQVSSATNLNFGAGAFTIDAWIKPRQVDSVDPIVAKERGPNSGYFLFLQSGKLYFQSGSFTLAGPPVTPNQWNFVAAVVSPPNIILYVGTSPGTSLNKISHLATINATNNEPLSIGHSYVNPHSYGIIIDEVEIFSRALTQQPELQSIFDAGSAGKCKPACPIIRIDPPTLGNQTWIANVDYPPESISATGGTEPHTFTVTGGTLPPGMVVDPYGTLYGKPVTQGTYDFTVTATDMNGCAAMRQYQIIITCPPITINPVDLPKGTPGTAYGQTITAAGGCAPYTLSVLAGALPPGLTLAADGALSGTPTLEGKFTFTVKATDDCGCTGERTYVLTVDCEPFTYSAGNVDDFQSPDDPALASAALRAAYLNPTKDFDDTTVDRYVEHTFTGLPANIVRAELEVRMRPDDYLALNDTINLAFTQSSPVARWASLIEGLPSALNPNQSWRRGDPARTFIFDLAALPPSGSLPTNLLADLATKRYLDVMIQDDTTVDYITLRIWLCQCPAITLIPAAGALPVPAINTPYSQTFSATGGCGSSFTYSMTNGALPEGLTLSAAGVLSGTATQTGTYDFTVSATDSCGCRQSQTYTLTANVRKWDLTFTRGMNEFCIWGGGGSYNSPPPIDNPYSQTPIGGTNLPFRQGNNNSVRYGAFGLCYGRILLANDRFAFKYTFNTIPVALLSYRDVNRDLGIPVPGSETRQNVFGAGLSPIGFQLYFRPQSRIKPFVNSSGGFIFFNDPVPQLNGARFNFTYDFGGGVQVFRDSRRAFTFGYKYQNISNGGRALNNPGFDGHVFYFGYSIFK